MSLHVELAIPCLRIGTLDPVAHFLGVRVADVVRPLLVGEPYIAQGAGVVRQEVFPLGLVSGACIELALGPFGMLWLENDAGTLVLVVPKSLASTLESSLGQPPTHIREEVAEFTISATPGWSASVPLGNLGAVSVRLVD